MTQSVIQKIAERAQADRSFLAQLIANPGAALAEYNLSSEEVASFAAKSPRALLKLLRIGKSQGGEPIDHDAGCNGSGTCMHTCGSTCEATFTTDIGDVDTITEGFTETP